MAQKIRIVYTDDDHECEVCGFAYATGAKIYVDGVLSLDLVPKAHCALLQSNWNRLITTTTRYCAERLRFAKEWSESNWSRLIMRERRLIHLSMNT
jgi:hypothetical protein